MDTTAVVFASPGKLALTALPLVPPNGSAVMVETCHSGISTGTERLLWTGDMPLFPGMGYPLVPGYETVGRVTSAPSGSGFAEGDLVFVPGANCYGPVRGLFGGAASHIASLPARLVKIPERLAESGTLLALAATAYHAVTLTRLPELIIGHGVLGRLMARMVVALGGDPVVWEALAARRGGSAGYSVTAPGAGGRGEYNCIADASGDARVLDQCIGHLAKRGEVILAGFYAEPVQFAFPPAFMCEASIRVAAEWRPHDLKAVLSLVARDKLSLDGLITHHCPAFAAQEAYTTAFTQPDCLKMVLDWRTLQ